MLLKAPQAKLALNFLIFSKHTFLSPRARHDVRREARKRRQRWLECIPKRQDTHPVMQMAVGVSNTVLLQQPKKTWAPEENNDEWPQRLPWNTAACTYGRSFHLTNWTSGKRGEIFHRVEKRAVFLGALSAKRIAQGRARRDPSARLTRQTRNLHYAEIDVLLCDTLWILHHKHTAAVSQRKNGRPEHQVKHGRCCERAAPFGFICMVNDSYRTQCQEKCT